MSDCKNGLFNCITPLPMDASGKLSDYEFLCWLSKWIQNVNNKIEDLIQITKQKTMSPLIDVAQYCDITGNDYVSEIIQNLINENPGGTFFFRGGNYKLNSPLIFPVDTNYNTYLFSAGARLFTDINLPAIAYLRNTTGSSNFRRILFVGGNFDCNSYADVGIVCESLARHVILIGNSVTNMLKYGIQIGSESSTNRGSYNVNLAYSYVRGNGNDIATAYKIFDNDIFAYGLVCADITTGIDSSTSSGHKFTDIHLYTGQTASEEMFSNTVGVIDGDSNFFENLYIDSFCTGFIRNIGRSSIITNLFFYWTSQFDYIANTVCIKYNPSTMLTITNLFVNRVNNVNAVEIEYTNPEIKNSLSAHRLKILNPVYTEFTSLSGNEYNYYYALENGSRRVCDGNTLLAGQALKIAYIPQLRGNFSVNLTTQFGNITLHFSSYDTSMPLINACDYHSGIVPFKIGVGNSIVKNGITFYPIYLYNDSPSTLPTDMVLTQTTFTTSYIAAIPYHTEVETVTPTEIFDGNLKNAQLNAGVTGTIEYINFVGKIYINANITLTQNITNLCNITQPHNAIAFTVSYNNVNYDFYVSNSGALILSSDLPIGTNLQFNVMVDNPIDIALL